MDWAMFYNLCRKDDDCERGLDHDGDCGLAIREGHTVIRDIETETVVS